MLDQARKRLLGSRLRSRSGDPTISGSLNSQYRAEADVELCDSLSFRIGVKIVDIRPQREPWAIEGHQTIPEQRKTPADFADGRRAS